MPCGRTYLSRKDSKFCYPRLFHTTGIQIFLCESKRILKVRCYDKKLRDVRKHVVEILSYSEPKTFEITALTPLEVNWIRRIKKMWIENNRIAKFVWLNPMSFHSSPFDYEVIFWNVFREMYNLIQPRRMRILLGPYFCKNCWFSSCFNFQ